MCSVIIHPVFPPPEDIWQCLETYLVVQSGYISWVETRGASDVESGYAFKVHLNAFYPAFVMLRVTHLFFINHVILTDTFWGYLVGNALWVVAVGY